MTLVTEPIPTTLQGIFDRVSEHLLTQGRKAGQVVDYSFQCSYRAPDGCTCAIGCLIPPNRYRADMEGKTAVQLIEQHGLNELRPFGFSLLKLQSIHDLKDVSCWRQSLADFAKSAGLLTAAMDAVP